MNEMKDTQSAMRTKEMQHHYGERIRRRVDMFALISLVSFDSVCVCVCGTLGSFNDVWKNSGFDSGDLNLTVALVYDASNVGSLKIEN